MNRLSFILAPTSKRKQGETLHWHSVQCIKIAKESIHLDDATFDEFDELDNDEPQKWPDCSAKREEESPSSEVFDAHPIQLDAILQEANPITEFRHWNPFVAQWPSQTTSSDYDNVIYTGGRDGCIHKYAYNDQSIQWCSSFNEHTDWISALALLDNVIVSASYDATIKLWSRSSSVSIQSCQKHKDHITSLATVKNSPIFYSAGLDHCILQWNINNLQQETELVLLSVEAPCSVYGLVAEQELLGAALSNNQVVFWDTRKLGFNPIHTLKGHLELVRAMTFIKERQFVTAGMDGCLHLWDLRQPLRPLASIKNETGITALHYADDVDSLFSGDAKGRIMRYNTDLSVSNLFTSAPATVLSMAADNSQLWVGTTRPSVYAWPLSTNKEEPSYVIRGHASLVDCVLLNDKQHVLTKNSSQQLDLWQIVGLSDASPVPSVVARLPSSITWEKALSALQTRDVMRSWCSVDVRLGCLSIHLDRHSAYDQEQYRYRLAPKLFQANADDTRVSLGQWWIASLWEGSTPLALPRMVFPMDAQLVLSHLISDSAGLMLADQTLKIKDLNENVIKSWPDWLRWVLENRIPSVSRVNKIHVHLAPAQGLQPLPSGTHRLAAHPMVRMRKLVHYVASKCPSLLEEGGRLMMACTGKLLDDQVTLATVKNHVWKSKSLSAAQVDVMQVPIMQGDVVLEYRILQDVN